MSGCARSIKKLIKTAYMKSLRTRCALLALASLTPASQALTFNFTPAPGTPAAAIAGFVAAGNRWSAIFDDPITVNIDIAFAPLGPGILGQASSTMYFGPYMAYKPGFIADASSAADALAVANLPGGPTVGALMNHTFENGNSDTAYYDNNGSYNNEAFLSTAAQLKALGLIPGNGVGQDADISFSSSFPFDFNPNDGITLGEFDFVGMATHEIGHAMGFVSGVDGRDYNPGFPENTPGLEQTLMDLFRYSAGVVIPLRDWTTSTRPKYFSIDGGFTSLAPFATGVNFGDGNQTSHWKDSLGVGIMDPTAGPGELLGITPVDVTMLDVLGFDVIPTEPVPEPATVWAGLALASLGALHIRRKARK